MADTSTQCPFGEGHHTWNWRIGHYFSRVPRETLIPTAYSYSGARRTHSRGIGPNGLDVEKRGCPESRSVVVAKGRRVEETDNVVGTLMIPWCTLNPCLETPFWSPKRDQNGAHMAGSVTDVAVPTRRCRCALAVGTGSGARPAQSRSGAPGHGPTFGHLGDARPPQTRGKPPGRQFGQCPGRSPRYPVQWRASPSPVSAS